MAKPKQFAIPYTSNKLFFGSVTPVGMKLGDIWADTGNNAIKIYSGSAWVAPTASLTANVLAANATGRGYVANNFFDAATVLAKFATDSMDNAQLIQIIKDGAFNADAATRALFDDGIWNLPKLATTAKTHVFNYQVEDLGAGVDIADRVIFAAPAGWDVTLVSASIIPQGIAAGIDDSNKCVVALTDGTNSIVSAEYDADPAFPAAAAVTSLGTLSSTYKALAAGEKLYLSVTNGTTANPPAFMLQVVYTVADAA